MAFGASYVAANSSASFVVRDLFLHQTIPDDITLVITGPEETIEELVFSKGQNMGKIEKMSVNSLKDLHLEFKKDSKVFLEYDIKGIESHFDWKPEQKENSTIPSITFSVSYNKNGLIEISDLKGTVK